MDLPAAARRLVERWRVQPNFVDSDEFELPRERESWLLAGGSGVVIVAWRLAPDDDLADNLFGRVVANVDNETDEIMWGSPGTLLAADAMHGWTGDERWLERARRFAVHALEQVDRRARPRYSLFTGDVGVALYAADCLETRSDYPVMDTWD